MSWLGSLALRSSVLPTVILGAPLPATQLPGDPVSFEREVLPLLAVHCQGCHQPAKASGSVQLVGYANLLGGDSPLVQAGAPEESLLLEVVAPTDGLPPSMPIDGEPLGADAVETLRRWIQEGAVDDSTAASLGARNGAGEPIYARPPVISAMAYSPDGATLAVSGRGEVLLHHAGEPGEPTLRLVGLSERVESIAFSPDGQRLAVAGGVPAVRGELQVWDVQFGELELSKSVSYDTLHGVSWSSDGTRVAFGCADHTVRVVDARTGNELLFQGAHADWVLGTAFSNDDSHLITVSRDRSMKLIKVDSQQFIDNITSITPGALRGGLMTVARRPGSDQLLVAGADGIPKMYRTFREKKRVIGDDYNLLRAYEHVPGRVFGVAWNVDGSRFVVGASLRGSGTIRVHDPEREAALWSVEVPSGVYAVALRPEVGEVAAGGFDGVVRIMDARRGKILHKFVPVPLTGDAEAQGGDSSL